MRISFEPHSLLVFIFVTGGGGGGGLDYQGPGKQERVPYRVTVAPTSASPSGRGLAL